jgi:hypothetical protein
MQNSKYRRGAVALANERMEQFRNLAYENVATKANAPVGDIEDDENVVINGLNYRIISSVFFVDDPADGLASEGDTKYEDYKRVSVTILWGEAVSDTVTKADALQDTKYESKRISLVSQFVPPGGLEVMPTGGILSINVLDTGVEPVDPVGGATISVIDNACGTTGHPTCDKNPIISAPTDSTGNRMYVGAPICTGCYEISITKSGYETRETLEPFTGDDGDTIPYEEGEFEPTYAHQSVTAGSITTITFNTNKIPEFTDGSDKTTALKITTQDPFGNVIPDVTFDITGGFVLGTDPDDGSNVYSLQSTSITTDNTTGEAEITSTTDTIGSNGNYAQAGLYTITQPTTMPSGYEEYLYWKVDPNDEVEMTHISVVADNSDDNKIKMLFGDSELESAGIRVVESVQELDDDGNTVNVDLPINEATVNLKSKNLTPQYDVTITTGDFGYAYFPETESEPLVLDETYDITVNADGYDENTDEVTITEDADGKKLQLVDITLTSQ